MTLPAGTIPYGRQAIDDDDVAAVVAALTGDWLTQGPAVEEFEAKLVEATGARFAVAFANGTAALHGACAAAGLGPFDRVAVPTLTFVASANAARYVGAEPVLVDIDAHTLNLDPSQVPLDVDALMAVHYAGLPVDLAAVRRRPRIVIEDAAHALGAITPDGPVGCCAWSDMTCFSFHPVKPVTTAEGGAVTTNSRLFADRLRRFRSHGTVPKPELGGWYYEVESLGYNYRLTDLQAALGASQLRKLEQFIVRRNELAERYRQLLAGLPVVLPPAAPGPQWRHGYHLFAVQLPDRAAVYNQLRAAGVGVQVHYVPVHRHPLYGGGSASAQFPVAERVYAGLLSLPLHPRLTDQQQDHVVAVLRDTVSHAA